MRRLLPLILLVGCGRFGFDADPQANPDGPTEVVARVTIQHSGEGGTVVGPDGFTCATGSCKFDVAPGTVVNLRGLAAAERWFQGWTGPCGGNFDCEIQVDADVTILADFSPTPNRVFVTSGATNGAIGGIGGADDICAAHASTANLTGTFIAYISDSTTSAPSRLAGSRGWIRTDGAPFADAPTAFSTSDIRFPVRLDELGNDLGDPLVFTGTSFGTTTVNHCQDWTSNAGNQNGTTNEVKYGSDSLGGGTRACTFPGHLLCTEIDRVVPVATRPDTGRMAFMSTTDWTPGGGRASADAHCASEAANAGLTGNFLAALATTTESLASRFPATEIYRRVDGVRLLRGPGMFTGEWLDVPPELDQFGAVVGNDFWTGTTNWNALPPAADTCNDWTDNTALVSGYLHWTTNTDLRSPAKTEPCDQAFPVLCVDR